ncbi:MAG: polysaccharide export protein [Rhizobiaceae bacterium]|nr:polysaccharide export protein [Rhizobiaceae bacterium]MBL4733254.1 polysaccharide export protein [Rhizobiaceae bacterium]
MFQAKITKTGRALVVGLTLAVSSTLIVGCSTYKPVGGAFHEALNRPYTLDSGDRLRVTVFEQTNLTNTYAIDKGGYLAMPLIGSITARGRTTKQLEAAIATGLRKGYLRNPDVSVEVDRYRPFFIMGEVGTSGQYTYVPGMTVQNAIAIAGGFSPRAEQKSTDITRQVNGQVMTGRVAISDPILPGDTIYVRERLF